MLYPASHQPVLWFSNCTDSVDGTRETHRDGEKDGPSVRTYSFTVFIGPNPTEPETGLSEAILSDGDRVRLTRLLPSSCTPLIVIGKTAKRLSIHAIH